MTNPRISLAAVLLAALALVAFFLSPGVSADDPPAKFHCRLTDSPPTIDGSFDDAVWKQATVMDNFRLPGADRKAPRGGTRARLLWDREYLYFAAEMADTDIQAVNKKLDGSTGKEDLFQFLIKPSEKHPGCYEFQANPNGATLSAFYPKRDAAKADVSFETKIAVKTTGDKGKDRGWTVEGRIPWRDLLPTGGRPAIGEDWRFSMCRWDLGGDTKEAELSTLAPLKEKNPHRFEEYIALRFLDSDGTSAIKPYGIAKYTPLTTSKVVGSPDPPFPFRVKQAFTKLKVPYPIGVAYEPGTDRLLLIHQQGSDRPARILRIKDDPDVTEAEEFLKPDDIVYGVAFHPDYATNGYLFVGSNGPTNAAGKAKMSRVTRYTVDRKPPYKIVPGSAKVIIEWLSNGHNGSDVAFGNDGMLYVTSGDGTSDSDTDLAGQDLTRLLAKVLRIDVDHPDAGKEYSVPKDNPFVGEKDIRPETWAYGFRNPWRVHVDRKTGDVWVGQNGQDTWEQVYLIKKGANYGWSVMEGGHPFYLNRKAGPHPISPPLVDHPHSEMRSITGGVVYHGKAFPELDGAYLYGDYSTGRIWGVRHKDGKVAWHKELAKTPLQITGFGTDSKGEILIADYGSGYYRLEATPKEQPTAKFPLRLSETGLFTSVKGHRMEPGMIPYSVNAPLWSDGAYKERYLGLPGADAHIDFSRSRGWNFPEATVIVKSFALEMEEGKPDSRRWIETRLLTRQQGEWVGYSYLWNDEQTDATLVESKGADREYAIKTATGERKQKWRYPSRVECMVCHTRASNYVLGLTEMQMNKVHNYGTVEDNQLRVLEHLGVLRMDYLGETRTALRDEAAAKGMSEKEANEYADKRTANRGQRLPADRASLLSFGPEKYKRLVDPSDPKQDLTARVKSYLHANCAICHVEAGGGNAMMELEYNTPLDKMRIVDVKPLHHTFDLTEPRIISPGHPERSTLLHRMQKRGEGQMPPLASSVVDREAVELLKEWITQLKTK